MCWRLENSYNFGWVSVQVDVICKTQGRVKEPTQLLNPVLPWLAKVNVVNMFCCKHTVHHPEPRAG